MNYLCLVVAQVEIGIMDYLHACLQTIFAKQGKLALSVPRSQN